MPKPRVFQLLAFALAALLPGRAPALCAGDCNGDGKVGVSELIIGTRIALERQALASCPTYDINGDGSLGIEELIDSVGDALRGCAGIVRTADDRFADLPGYPFAAQYMQVGPLRIHYIDEGPADGPPVLMLHGEPSWSYLYRKMIPIITDAGYRAVVPDLVGFGKSDKPADREDYTYQRHVDWMRALIEQLDLRDIILVGQDWGGLIGLRLAAEDEDRFAAIVTSNTFLPTGDVPPSQAFLNFRNFSQRVEVFPVGILVQGGTVTSLGADIVAAYDAPHPGDEFKAGARQFPILVPISPDDPAAPANRRAWEVLERWEKPFLTAFSDSDPITHGGDLIFQARVPGAAGQPHTTIENGGHFVQEDAGEIFAQIIVEFLE